MRTNKHTLRPVGGVAAARSATVTIVAQSLSSLTNFVIAALALNASSLAAFGRFSLVFQLCQVIVVVGNGSIGSAVLVHSSQHPTSERARAIRNGAATAALLLGAIASGALVVAAVAAGNDYRTELLIAAIGAPGLVAQYVLRAHRFSLGNPSGALLADIVWFGIVLGAGAMDLFDVWNPSSTEYLAVWLMGASASAAPIFVAGLRNRARHLVVFWQVAGRQSVRLGAEAALSRSVFVTSLIAAQVIIDARASGALAAAVLALSPLSVVHEAFSIFLLQRFAARDGIHVLRYKVTLLISAAVGASTMLWVLAVALANIAGLARGPFELDANGVTWALFIAMSARFIALGVWRGPIVALRVADATKESLRSRAIGTVAQWILPIIAMMASGLVAGAAALALGTAIGVAAAWVAVLRVRRRENEHGLASASRSLDP